MSFPIQEEVEIETEIINIYSGDRNRSVFPDPNYYNIHLLEKIGKTFKNVVSLRLLSGILPDVNDITQEPFLILKINEISTIGMTGTNNTLNNGSTILQLDRPVSSGYFLNLKSDICKCIYSSFKQPLAELSRFTVQICDINGNLFNFGSDNVPPLSPNKSLQHLLSFEIKYKVKRNVIQNLNY